MLKPIHPLPLFTTVSEQLCIVVGGGPVALRRITTLVDAGARVVVIAPKLCQTLTTYIVKSNNSPQLVWLEKTFEDSDLSNFGKPKLVVAATDDTHINSFVAISAQMRQIMCNVTDEPENGDISFPATVQRNPITIAISSGGSSPVLTRLIKAKIETLLPQGYSQLAELAHGYRNNVKAAFESITERKRFWEHTLGGRVADLVLANRTTEAEDQLKLTLNEHSDSNEPVLAKGEVYLVGAGPGDPELLTIRAHRLMQQADVVVYDRLVSDEVMAQCRADAVKIYAGKKRDLHALQQHEINDTLVKLAREGKRVLRLKGGDPFIFGRGGEEIETLAENNIPFQVVPGITAASGCSAYAGIPLTHRDHAQACVFVTGHVKDGKLQLPWESLVAPSQTVVCYMGLVNLAEICARLIEHGMSPTVPAAVIEKGTTAQQRVIAATVSTLADEVAAKDVSSPAMLIIGGVVSLHDTLAWHAPQSALEAASSINEGMISAAPT